MRRQHWLITALVAAVAVLSTLLIVGGFGRPSGVALGQQSAVAGYIIGLTGMEKNGRLPLVLIDTKEQTIIAYEYNYSRHRLILSSVRPYRYDRQLQEYYLGATTTQRANGLSVQNVQQRLRKQESKRSPR